MTDPAIMTEAELEEVSGLAAAARSLGYASAQEVIEAEGLVGLPKLIAGQWEALGAQVTVDAGEAPADGRRE